MNNEGSTKLKLILRKRLIELTNLVRLIKREREAIINNKYEKGDVTTDATEIIIKEKCTH